MSLTKVSFSMVNGASFNVLDYGADNTGVVDSTTAVQAAINAAHTAGGGQVYFPGGTYKIAAASGNTVTLPTSGATMPYSVELKANVFLRGEAPDAVELVGGWTYRTTAVNTSQLIMFNITEAPSGISIYLENLQISNCMIGFYNKGIVVGTANNITFNGTAIAVITQQQERFEWDNIYFNMGAGIVNGGWWIVGGSNDSGGWSDKCQYNRLNYIRFQLGWTSTENDIDTFFNANFFNNAAGSVVVPYKGIVGTALYSVNRRSRGSFNCNVTNLFAYGAPRAPIYVGVAYAWTVSNISYENVGYADYTATSVMGVGTVDPWNAGKLDNAVAVTPGNQLNDVACVYATTLAATNLVTALVGNYSSLFALGTANPDLTNVPTANRALSGTMTPALSFGAATTGITYTSSTGNWTMIGDFVFASIDIILSSKGSATGVARITLPNLPGVSGFGTFTVSYFVNQFVATVIGGSATSASLGDPPLIDLYNMNQTSVVALTQANFTNTTRLVGTVTYRTNYDRIF